MCNGRRRAIRCCCVLPLLLLLLSPVSAVAAGDVEPGAAPAGDVREEAARAAEARQAAIRAEFEAELQAYHDAPPPSRRSWRISNEALSHLQKMRWMGPHILPYLVEEARRSRDMSLTLPLGGIARVAFTRARWPGGHMPGARRHLDLLIEWWDAGQKRADEMFAEAYAEDDVVRIDALGWGVMPRIVEKLREGDADLMPAVKQIALVELRVKRIPASAIESPEAWVAWWEENKEDWAIPFPDLKKKAEEKAKGEATPDDKPEGDAKPDESAKGPEPAPREH